MAIRGVNGLFWGGMGDVPIQILWNPNEAQKMSFLGRPFQGLISDALVPPGKGTMTDHYIGEKFSKVPNCCHGLSLCHPSLIES